MKAAIQVVICKCCTDVPLVLDLSRLEKLASDSDNVVSVAVVNAVCDGKELAGIVKNAVEKEADRAVVLACHKKDFSPALAKAYKRAGINEFLVEIVNLREEVVVPIKDDKERAQAKAETILNAALARARMLTPLERKKEDMRTRNVVIIGAGVTGQAAAGAASESGVHTIIIEKSTRTVKAPGIIMSRSQVVGAKGYSGNYELEIQAGEKSETLECAAIVIASGGGWTHLKGPLAKSVKDSIPLYELFLRVRSGPAPKGPIVVIDTPDPAGKTMKTQDYAWAAALETVIDLKKRSPETVVYVVFQEMRAFGVSELDYKLAAEMGVKFVRYDKGGFPKIDQKDPHKIVVKDASQGDVLSVPFGTLAFASIPMNESNQVIADALRIPMAQDGGIRRGSLQRGPVSTPRPGIFVCGSALFPKPREVARAEGEAAGSLAGEYVKGGVIEFGGSVAQVTAEKCSACLTCVRTCPYEAPFIGAASKAEIRTQLCQGCGVCAGICPSKAIDILHYTDDQVMEQTRVILGGDF
ncbi:MAG TPA: 4Fe-4S binding protein [Thermoplasmata archaeon]